MKILDLDMDYFMTEIANTPYTFNERLDEEYYGGMVWTVEKVRHFLENNLGLSKTNKIPGRIVQGHNEALFFWEELIECKKLLDPFDVVHVDSHADLGLGDASWSFLQSAFLNFPTETRRKIRDYEFCGQIKGISIGDYLLWAIAYKMISSITYCANPNGNKNDYVVHTLKNFEENYVYNMPTKNYIQLKYNNSIEISDINLNDITNKQIYLKGAIKDPEVELLIIPTIEDVRFKGDFDYAVMAQSPNYTPANADFIVKVFSEYIYEI